MDSFKCDEVIKQINEFNKKLQQLKEDIQSTNQILKKSPACGLNPKGPMSQILTTLEECSFFFENLLKNNGLKYLPLKEDASE